mmetsp:Transcript_37674/g.56893  ORF Transcript_37674/g.56893 Transcript_37674/m.56893 type:complete len:194 (-) Transcript_37674:39-620(-)|eukprot:CAMPEP_0194752142 /NCGR_PEP_ID=MMETSP0323_2-20130528/5972_1 /TAXON_ID=2866 ORGANISM="Crypthecodinium cohnii, Strain Seligo" /NCGR_SAMPLE_ID=MMETSP0323_2 /ASSEMBLY_ACC=CAM_ASM_000346 /LENGTH=193 /DNA_ID=CAMNT_0039668887 /DNA_START=152 /DNA_END=733 /DNA_ORIENTATION=-
MDVMNIKATRLRGLEGPTTIFAEGPLEIRLFRYFWRPRYAVLTAQEWRLYSSEEEAHSFPEHPLLRIQLRSLSVACDKDEDPCMIELFSSSAFGPEMVARTGSGETWEEIVSASLWVEAVKRAKRCEEELRRRGLILSSSSFNNPVSIRSQSNLLAHPALKLWPQLNPVQLLSGMFSVLTSALLLPLSEPKIK